MEDIVHLVRQVQTGSTDAFTVLVDRFQNMAYGYAYAILGDFDLAQDAAQEAFIEAYKGLPVLREPMAFPVWFKRIVYKYCDRLLRQKRLTLLPLENIVGTASNQPGPQEIYERKEMSRQLAQALQAIPAALRTVTMLFYAGGYSHQEIADFLGISIKTVKSRLYTSRQRLKERMVVMLQDEFAQNPLPEQFTHETVEQAVSRAAALNKEKKYEEAEKMLRVLLAQVPEHPEALKELNRAMMRGRVYGQGRWDLLAELATQGKMILKTSDDEEIHRQVAQTLLAIPAMGEGISFLKDWISIKGPTLERLGMLAWAQGCSGDFNSARRSWEKLIDLSHSLTSEKVLQRLPFIAYTLANCFAAASQWSHAQAIARQSWAICGHIGPLPAQESLKDDSDWLNLWHMAKLDMSEIVPILLERHPESTGLVEQAVRLAILGWIDPAEIVATRWLDWAQVNIAAANYAQLGKYRLEILLALRKRSFWREANQLASNIWEILGNVHTAEADQVRKSWDWERFNPFSAIETGNWVEAHELVNAEIKARGVEGAVGWAAIVAGSSGSPTPPEIVQALDENGVSQVDEYGMFGWYILAREAAHQGDATQAFDALRKALAYWTNTPYWITDLWEKDTYWGLLHDSAEFKQAFDQRRERIGTIYGELHYFPGW